MEQQSIIFGAIFVLALVTPLIVGHPGDGGGGDDDGLPPCEDGEPPCICKARQQQHCYEHIAEIYERDLKKCHVHEDYCGKKGRKKRDDATWKNDPGYKGGVRRMMDAMKNAQYCAQDAIHTAVEECGLHGSSGDPEKTFWENVEATYGCKKATMQRCIKARVPEKGSEFKEEMDRCKEVYDAKACEKEIQRLQCECIQKAKPIIDLKCRGEVSFFLQPTGC